MGRAPLLFIVVAGKILVHSTYEQPRPNPIDNSLDDKAGLIDVIDLVANVEQTRQTLKKYRREELLSGRFWEQKEIRKRFNPQTRVERNLLANLSAIRSKLLSQRGLDPQTVHSLLGRAIFIQYLQDRKDANEYSAFPKDYFDGFLSGAKSFSDVLSSKKATYTLFEALEAKFNGDIFPVTPSEGDNVQDRHLDLLAQFLRGKTEIRSGQYSFWPHYSFNAIPIEFISNMYEEFFHYERQEEENTPRRERRVGGGNYYTPQRLVEFMLDEVLPWEGTNSQIHILDPACGSGIFLVESYRRLISRWQQANPTAILNSELLKKILVENIHGVDKNPEAIRVAAFSLYLTMCDYLDPRHIWSKVKFPPLREKNLWDQDFFDFVDDPPENIGSFDLIIGNPPWESQFSKSAGEYVKNKNLPVGDKQIAQAFLWASPQLCKDNGRICLIAPGKGLLFNASGPNKAFRRKFLNDFKINTIFNFACLRKNLFAKAVGPAAPIIYEPAQPPENHEIVYCCPKPSNSPEDAWHYVIENHDICRIPWEEAIQHEEIWKTAMWGSPRDWELIEKLAKFSSIREVADQRGWMDGEGFIVGTGGEPAEWLTGKRYVAPDALLEFTMEESSLPRLRENNFYRAAKTKRKIFKGPHLLIRQSPKASSGFIAALLQGDTVFNSSILGISGSSQDIGMLGATCVAFATDIYTYFAMMTSSRWLVERDELEKGEIMSLPVPQMLKDGDLEIPFSELKTATKNINFRKKLVKKISDTYALSRADQTLINDAVKYTLDYFRLGAKSEAVKPTDENMLRKYAFVFLQVLGESFGEDNDLCFPARFYIGQGPMIVLEVSLLSGKKKQEIEVCNADDKLSDALNAMDRVLLEERSAGVFVRRDVHMYRDEKVYIAKRNQQRLWTESVAMREADEIYAEIMTAWSNKHGNSR
jgi:type I restriction-modification system DNA methylase subunit